MNVRIYKTSKTAMQSGRAKAGIWIIEYEKTSARRPEYLMGWSSSEDTLNQVRLSFDTKKDAIYYAKEQGWQYEIREGTKERIRPRNYSDNFRYIPTE